ncbi:MAG: anthranilate phosphoribosyltransferase [Acidobacteria bacterium]|nr:MAG: anthranilate phosphoribosyltransferase [Acidobacteriota bacterium]
MEPQDALRRVLARQDLSREEMESLIGRLMDGELGEAMQAALLVGLAMKGEAVAEIAGAAAAMRRRVLAIPHRLPGVIDTCGTGGDGKGTFNVSTAAALVAAAAGAKVAKHGNRSVSSRSGSADVLAALGVRIDLDAGACGRALEEIGIAFLFAPRLHPAMKAVMPVRRALGVRTIFNVLGPLTNPAGARRQLLGVYDRRLVETLARVLAELGSERAMVVHGADGLDEITVTASTHVAELKGGEVTTYELDPRDLGLERASPELLRGGTPEENAALFEAVLAGDASTPRGRALIAVTAVNAAAALYVAGLAPDLAAGLELARTAIAGGRARRTLEALRDFAG